MAGCLNFETDEYFKRYLATNQTVRMYTRLLSYHASNDAAVNHYAYSYFQRMCSFRLQQDYPAPSRPPYGSKSFTDSLGAGAAESSGTAATVVMSETSKSPIPFCPIASSLCHVHRLLNAPQIHPSLLTLSFTHITSIYTHPTSSRLYPLLPPPFPCYLNSFIPRPFFLFPHHS